MVRTKRSIKDNSDEQMLEESERERMLQLSNIAADEVQILLQAKIADRDLSSDHNDDTSDEEIGQFVMTSLPKDGQLEAVEKAEVAPKNLVGDFPDRVGDKPMPPFVYAHALSKYRRDMPCQNLVDLKANLQENRYDTSKRVEYRTKPEFLKRQQLFDIFKRARWPWGFAEPAKYYTASFGKTCPSWVLVVCIPNFSLVFIVLFVGWLLYVSLVQIATVNSSILCLDGAFLHPVAQGTRQQTALLCSRTSS